MKTVEVFKKTWANRQSITNIDSEAEMEQFILIELNDELSHPRVRKTKQQKLHLAIQRIHESQLEQQQKQALIEVYIKIAAQLD